MKRFRVAVIHPQPRAGGGSENKALWIMETLKETADVSFVAMGDILLDELNRAYGTRLNPRDIRLVEIPIPPLLKKRCDALRTYRLERYVRRHASDYDILISTYNVMDFGTCGIQFISDFSFNDRLRREFYWKPRGLGSWAYRKSPFRSAYLALGKVLSGRTSAGWRRNWTVSNSDWGGKIFEEVFGLKSRTIYPPVIDDYPDIPWEDREDGFVIIGRLVPEKQVDRMIRILQRIRKEGWNVHLHILGGGDDPSYASKINRLAAANPDWVFLEGLIFGAHKRNLLARHRFGLHGCENELIGNAVIEMVKAGCLVWVPEKGGATEIVGHPGLIYRNDAEAVRKIIEVLSKDELIQMFRTHLRSQADKFSVEKFQAQIRELIQQFVNRDGTI
jgi:glycosyltransferase involved in cell wall biosynthesis